ncbi:DUF6223 family protein [Streptomyces sp. NPDC000151]|uniref:DUF6223 family protein n=1 Tax=Streptomyces sp. NPDC000151 TaxID=3154244 RepID=UPI00333380CF
MLAEPAAAHASVQSAATTVYGPTPDRIRASAAALLALTGVVIGGLAVARSTGRIGTGNGIAAGYIALALGLIATVLGGMALARSRRSG